MCYKRHKKNPDSFLNFLCDSKFCVLNGRLNLSTDNFTSISSKSCALVDYMCVPYSGLQFVHTFHVITMKDIIINIDYQSSEISALPDHSILCCTINMSPYYRQGIKCKTNDCSTDVNSSTPKLCSVQKI